MKAEEKALELCDRIGITEPIERDRFVMGYKHGAIDAKLEAVEEMTKLFSRSKSIPDAETR